MAHGSSLETDRQLGPHSSTTGEERRALDLGHDPGRVSVTLTTKSPAWPHSDLCHTPIQIPLPPAGPVSPGPSLPPRKWFTSL